MKVKGENFCGDNPWIGSREKDEEEESTGRRKYHFKRKRKCFNSTRRFG